LFRRNATARSGSNVLTITRLTRPFRYHPQPRIRSNLWRDVRDRSVWPAQSKNCPNPNASPHVCSTSSI
jgi:hypothetical protein